MGEGIELAVVGLAVVFLFLSVMVATMHGLGWLSVKLDGRITLDEPAGRGGSLGSDTLRRVAAIAALHQHRHRRRSSGADG